MKAVQRFVRAHVDPADRLAEMIFGLVMALGVTGAIRVGGGDLDNSELFVSVLGCNMAWSIVDAVVLVIMRIFERGRRARVIREAREARDDAQAIRIIEEEVDRPLVEAMTPEERSQVQGIVLAVLRRTELRPPALHRGDLLHGAAAGLVVLLPTLPVVAPYLVFDEPLLAVRVSFAIALTSLFVVGFWWGRVVGGRAWRIGGSLTLLGLVLVAITVALGG
jgi:hypothetical protein